MTDASLEGFGVVHRDASLEMIKEEAQYSERRGWMVRTDAEFTEEEYVANIKEDDPIMMGMEPPPNLFDMTAFAKPMYILLHLFSGRRRTGDFQFYVEQKGREGTPEGAQAARGSTSLDSPA